MSPDVASAPDLLRLLSLPLFVWVAYRDIRTRRVPSRTWLPIGALAVVLLAWDALAAWEMGGLVWRVFSLRVAMSLLIVVPMAYGFYRLGAFGGADAKALFVLALLFPTFPTYIVLGTVFPLGVTPVGVFSLTILTNAVLVGAAYPFVLFARNALSGHRGPIAFIATPVPWDEVEETHGRVVESREGFDRSGLDLDALRMYLRWRGTTLADLREDAVTFRDPASIPTTPNPVGDGAVATDGGPRSDDGLRTDGGSSGDPWGAEAFLIDVGPAYGTTPERLREGLDLLTEREVVWVSPGIPFLVPISLGLLVSLVYGNVLFSLLSALGLA
ncbi:A24 family peptidase C-terminal domain-containing protein [Natronorarus salvus]|uniref:A24 family peptidase C-terminal domain-containing protein n=1 Tax=Natronorarus salvus TaxID=3117733 RepID=UPI002F26C7CF